MRMHRTQKNQNFCSEESQSNFCLILFSAGLVRSILLNERISWNLQAVKILSSLVQLLFSIRCFLVLHCGLSFQTWLRIPCQEWRSGGCRLRSKHPCVAPRYGKIGRNDPLLQAPLLTPPSRYGFGDSTYVRARASGHASAASNQPLHSRAPSVASPRLAWRVLPPSGSLGGNKAGE